MPQVNLDTVNQKNTPALYTDIFANRPNYGIPGRLFISTDTQQIFEDSGTAWSVVANVTSSALVGTLQQVTTNGSTTSIGITITAGGLTSNAVTISGGTSSQFLKANGTLDGSAYITLSNLSATSPVTYNNSTGVIQIGQATNSTSGYLSSTDWNTFNGKQSAISLTVTGSSGAATLIGSTLNIPNYTYTLPQATGAVLGGVVIGSNISVASGVISLTNTNITTALGFTPYNATNPNSYISLTSLSGSAPISYSNTTGAIGISQAGGSTNGYLTSTDWNTFNNKQAAINGTGFVKASGTTISYDNSTYLTTATASSTYVPYTGATGAVTLGSNSFTAGAISGTAITGSTTRFTSNGSDAGYSFYDRVNTSHFWLWYATGDIANLYNSGLGTNAVTFNYATNAATFSNNIGWGGVTPTGDGLNSYTLESTQGSQIASRAGFPQLYISSNVSGTPYSPTRKVSGYALQMFLDALGGTIGFNYAATGSAGSSITWLNALYFNNTGAVTFASSVNSASSALQINPTNGYNVLIGTPTDAGYKLQVNGTASVSQIITGQTYLNASTFNQSFTISQTNGAGTTILSNNSTNYTWTLEPATGNNRLYILRTIGSNTITINTSGSDVIINNAGTSVSSLTMVAATGAIILQSDGNSRWIQIK